MKAKYLAIAGLAFAAFGCGISAQDEARNNMLQSQGAYSQCLQQDRSDTSGCKGYKQLYDSDLHAYHVAASATVSDQLITGCPPADAIADWSGHPRPQRTN